jgi:uncharacterized protein
MKIWFDIGHLAQYNFYKYAIINLSKTNIVLVTAIDRGKLINILFKELEEIGGCKVIKVGKHTGNKYSIILRSNILRFIQLCFFYFKYKPDISVGNGFLHGFVGKLFNKPRLMFGDDIERKLDFMLKKFAATEIYYANVLSQGEKIKSFNALKEWAYLSPSTFSPIVGSLSFYNLSPKNYIFIREVSVRSLNYANQKENLIASISNRLPQNLRVVLSLEDKSSYSQYPKDWILLSEPVSNIHSLIYFSKILISSGDSMAREGAILGVPSIYCGVRKMAANEMMIGKGMLLHKKIDDVPLTVKHIIANDLKFPAQDDFRARLLHEWVDVTEFIVYQIRNIK